MFEHSPVSKRIFSYFNERIGQVIAPIGLLKVLSIHSAGSPFPRLSVLHEARSREWKTQTNLLAMKFFSDDMYIYISGEKTIHGMVKDYGRIWNNKCLVVNDGTLLFSSLAKRSRDRWLTAISVLLTEKKYEYSDNVQRFKVLGKISLLVNLATPSFAYYKNELFRATLGNRLFVVHGWLNREANRRCKANYEKTAQMPLPLKEKITEHYNRTIRNLNEYKKEIEFYADEYSALAVRNPIECQDIVTAIISENARINKRNRICDDDIKLVRMLRYYNIDPEVPDEPRVIEFLKQGRSYEDICHLLNKPRSYYSTISYYRKKAKRIGALDEKE
ncbi:MAG: hypothetical protein K6T73_06615 [Candidatus Bathyarchaeota archaeon]|nr:hypothetical protein [Candidatus Bathyarchaeota archaeon]